MRLLKGVIFTAVFVVLLCTVAAPAQNFANGFPFALPAQDSSRQFFMPHFPARSIAADEFVTVDGRGHFAVKGERIRFWGTNCGADGAFPGTTQSPFIAARLRKMGFNLVRMHHLDNPWSNYSLFERHSDTRHLNATMLTRWEKFIYELKKNGIYANVNLHVSRTFSSQDGVVDADSIVDYGKAVSYIDQSLWPLYKEYARQLLTHLNPFTQTRLVDDPVMAMVEITNENSLYRWWRDGHLKPFNEGGRLTLRHARLLDQQWQAFLRRKYATTVALQAAWQQGARDGSARELIKDGGFERGQLMQNWQLERHEGAKADMGNEVSQPFQGLLAARVNVTSATATGWHVQWKQVGFTIEKDSLYTVTFAARAHDTRSISVTVMRDNSPWTTYGGGNFQLTAQWQRFSFTFRAPETCLSQSRLSFGLGAETGTYWFDVISVQPASIHGLLAAESLEAGTVGRNDYNRCVAFSDARVADLSAFYVKVQDDFFAEMARFLKQELGVRVPITGTNWNVGPGDIVVQSKLDYIDNHAYWDHPHFPNEPWSSYDWSISNTPMVQSPDGGSIARVLNAVAVAGKPFTISEYNHCFPNRYQSEGPVFLVSYAALHDADGIMMFDNGGSNDHFESDFIDSYFGIHRNTAMMSLMPSCAQAFRQGYIAPARQTIGLALSESDVLLLPKSDTGDWQGPALTPPQLSLQHKVRYETFQAAMPFSALSLPPTPLPPYVSDTEEITWNPAGLLQTITPRFLAFTGLLQQFTGAQMGDLQLISADGFATCTWLSLDGEPLSQADISLLTLSTRAQNSGMVWDGIHTVHGRWGVAPTLMAPVRLELMLSIQADSIRIHALDTRGNRLWNFRTITPSAPGRFRVILDQSVDKTVWYGIERLGDSSNVGTPGDGVPGVFALPASYPNPFLQPGSSAAVQIPFEIPARGKVQLVVYDVLGRRVRTLCQGQMEHGRHIQRWNGRDDRERAVADGVYFYVLDFSNTDVHLQRSAKMMIMK